MKMPAGILAAAAASLLMSGAASAQSYNFQDVVSSSGYSVAPTVGPGVDPTSSPWTGFQDNGTYVNNGVSLALSGFTSPASNPGMIDGPDPYNGTPAFLLSQSLQTPTSGEGFLELGNVPTPPAGDTYDLYLYGTNFDGTDSTVFQQGILGITFNSSSLGVPNDSFAENVNYVLLTNIGPQNGVINVLVRSVPPGYGIGDLNGLQLVVVPIPEPSTAGLLAVAAAGLLARRRRA
jgi:hypothetical protein